MELRDRALIFGQKETEKIQGGGSSAARPEGEGGNISRRLTRPREKACTAVKEKNRGMMKGDQTLEGETGRICKWDVL